MQIILESFFHNDCRFDIQPMKRLPKAIFSIECILTYIRNPRLHTSNLVAMLAALPIVDHCIHNLQLKIENIIHQPIN